MSGEAAASAGITPIARVVGFCDAATEPIDFPIAPTFATNKVNGSWLLLYIYFIILLLCTVKPHYIYPDKTDIAFYRVKSQFGQNLQLIEKVNLKPEVKFFSPTSQSLPQFQLVMNAVL